MIVGYTAVVDPQALGDRLEAFVELYCADSVAPGDLLAAVARAAGGDRRPHRGRRRRRGRARAGGGHRGARAHDRAAAARPEGHADADDGRRFLRWSSDRDPAPRTHPARLRRARARHRRDQEGPPRDRRPRVPRSRRGQARARRHLRRRLRVGDRRGLAGRARRLRRGARARGLARAARCAQRIAGRRARAAAGHAHDADRGGRGDPAAGGVRPRAVRDRARLALRRRAALRRPPAGLDAGLRPLQHRPPHLGERSHARPAARGARARSATSRRSP